MLEYISGFGTGVGHNGYFAGGGGGNTYAGAGNPGYANGGRFLFGGGGIGGFDSDNEVSAGEGLEGTGGGGGGSKYDGGVNEDWDGGDGGSGIVIIKYRTYKFTLFYQPPTGFLKYDANLWDVENQYLKTMSIIITTDINPLIFNSVIIATETNTNENVGLEIRDLKYGKLFITTSVNKKPEYTQDILTGAGYMNNHLEVDGKIKSESLKVDNTITAGGTISAKIIYGDNLCNINGAIGNTLTFSRNQMDIGVGGVGFLHWMENSPANGFGFTNNYKRGQDQYGRYIRFWIRGATNGAGCNLQGYADHYYDGTNGLRFMNGNRLTNNLFDTFSIYSEGNKGSTFKVSPWYDTSTVGGDGFRLGVKCVSGGIFYMTQVVLEFTKNPSGLE